MTRGLYRALTSDDNDDAQLMIAAKTHTEPRDIARLLMPNDYVKHLTRTFGNDERLTEGTGLAGHPVAGCAAAVPVTDVLKCLGNAMHLATRPDWYLEWAQAMAAQCHEPVTTTAVQAPTLGAGLDAFLRYIPAQLPYHAWRAFTDDDAFVVEVEERIDFGELRHIVIEVPLLVMSEYVQGLAAPAATRARIELRYSPTAHADLYRHWFQCDVAFNAPRNALVLPRAWRDIANPAFDEQAWKTALARCEETDAGDSEARISVARIRAAVIARIAAAPGRPPPRLADVAREFHCSPRTLLRHLRAAGATYQQITDDIQKARAVELLHDRSRPVYDVGNELGFEDPASFGRSFKRWFDTTPGAYRRSLIGND